MTFAAKLIRKNFKLLLLALLLMPVQPAKAAGGSVLIHQLQTGSSAGASQEFISLYNNTNQPADITHWCLSYLTASGLTETSLICFMPPDIHTRLLLKEHGTLLLVSSEYAQTRPEVSSSMHFTSGLSAAGGHLKLVNSAKDTVDKLGWGSASQPESAVVSAPPAGKILARIQSNDTELQDTDNNSMDFQLTVPGPLKNDPLTEDYNPVDLCANIDGLQISLPNGFVQAGENCQELENASLFITEILPDALGADDGNEFIELHNPHDKAVNLAGYGLQLGPAYAKTYQLPDMSIDPGEYAVLNDQQTGLVLPNASASVRLLTPRGETVSTSDAYSQPGEGAAWALIDDVWQLSYQPTPGRQNISQPTRPCPAGQLRSPLAGSCRSIGNLGVVPQPATCRPDQIRNPATGRCRLAASSSAKSSVCKAGQVRNPQTNRCRSATTNNSAPKACPAGQERNSETGRCRKVKPGTTASEVKDVKVPLLDDAKQWWLAGVASVGSVGYAAFEWRRDLWEWVHAAKNKLGLGL